jgi:hypothetical protein
MTDDNKIEDGAAEQPSMNRRAYEAPAVKDFFQPLVVLGTGPATVGFDCATPKPPKHR